MAGKPNKKSSTCKKLPNLAAYISFNRDEREALGKVGFRERWCYSEAKWLANFKTGVVGTFRKTRLSYQDLANLVTAPGVQGRSMGSIDDKEAHRILQRLEEVGLVAHIGKRGDNGGLVFELPMSPINRKATPKSVTVAEAISPDGATQEADFLPDADVPPFDDSPMFTGVSDAPALPLSVLALTESKNNTGGAHSAIAEVRAPRRAASAPPSHAVGVPLVEKALTPSRAPTALAPKQIRDSLASDWVWADLETPEAESLYEHWSHHGLTDDLLFQATTELGAALDSSQGPLSPLALAPVLARLGISADLVTPEKRRMDETGGIPRAMLVGDSARVLMGSAYGRQAGGHRPNC